MIEELPPDPDCQTCKGKGEIEFPGKNVSARIPCPTCIEPWGMHPGQRRI